MSEPLITLGQVKDIIAKYRDNLAGTELKKLYAKNILNRIEDEIQCIAEEKILVTVQGMLGKLQ